MYGLLRCIFESFFQLTVDRLSLYGLNRNFGFTGSMIKTISPSELRPIEAIFEMLAMKICSTPPKQAVHCQFWFVSSVDPNVDVGDTSFAIWKIEPKLRLFKKKDRGQTMASPSLEEATAHPQQTNRCKGHLTNWRSTGYWMMVSGSLPYLWGHWNIRLPVHKDKRIFLRMTNAIACNL